MVDGAAKVKSISATLGLDARKQEVTHIMDTVRVLRHPLQQKFALLANHNLKAMCLFQVRVMLDERQRLSEVNVHHRTVDFFHGSLEHVDVSLVE